MIFYFFSFYFSSRFGHLVILKISLYLIGITASPYENMKTNAKKKDKQRNLSLEEV